MNESLHNFLFTCDGQEGRARRGVFSPGRYEDVLGAEACQMVLLPTQPLKLALLGLRVPAANRQDIKLIMLSYSHAVIS